MTDARTALLLAADQIEKDPTSFSFVEIDAPKCGSPACALGWVFHFLGLYGNHWTDVQEEAAKAIFPPGLPRPMRPASVWDDDRLPKPSTLESWFYDEMDALTSGDWRRKTSECVTGLRRFADKYHPEVEQRAAA